MDKITVAACLACADEPGSWCKRVMDIRGGKVEEKRFFPLLNYEVYCLNPDYSRQGIKKGYKFLY
jgi:hypothetical protein